MILRGKNMENRFCEYQGIRIGKEPDPEVSEREIDEAVEQLLNRNSVSEKVDRPSRVGDVVNLDFEGFCDGVAFEGGKGENYDLELGSNTFIPGFEDQLVGCLENQRREVRVKFPENYHAGNLKGKEAVFKCLIHEVKEKKPAVLDDLFARDHGSENVEALRLSIKEEIEEANRQKAVNAYFDKLAAHLLRHSAIEVSAEEEEISFQSVKAYYEQMVGQYGMNLEQYLNAAGKSMEEFQKIIRPEVVRNAKLTAFLLHVADQEKLVCTDEEAEKELNAIVRNYHLNAVQRDEFKKRHFDELKQEITKRKATGFLVSHNE